LVNPLKLLLDAAAGAALAFVLLVVLVVDRLMTPAERVTPNTLDVRVVTDSGPAQPAKRKLRLMVLTDPVPDNQKKMDVIWDDMSRMLTDLGEGYQHQTIRTSDLLRNPDLLQDVDVLFFTCAPGGHELRDVLVRFVSRGGVLYASDWRYDAVADAFPDVVDAQARGEGASGAVTAEVVDPGLRELIGPTIHLNFDLAAWKTAAFKGPRVSVLLKGDYRKLQGPSDNVGVPATAPLLVRFPVGRDGQVIFTSFHNEKQNNETEKKLLQYLVFTMVTAGVEAHVQSHLTEGGFAPQRSNLLSTPKTLSTTKTFRNEHAGPLRFALGFRDEGARLRLHLQSPDGKTFTWEGTSTVMLEVPHAAAGEWSYTITALELPYENFPFLVTVGEKQ
jgi:hypothetical protein